MDAVEEAAAWDYRIGSKEFSVAETFCQSIQAIFEDAGNWLLGDSTQSSPTRSPIDDLHMSVDRMISAIQDFTDDDLSSSSYFSGGRRQPSAVPSVRISSMPWDTLPK